MSMKNNDASPEVSVNDIEDDESDMPPLEDINEGKGDGDFKANQDNEKNVNKEKGKKEKTIRIGDKKEDKPTDEDGWLDILDNGELKKKVLIAGDSGKPRPERGCTAIIQVTTRLYDTQEIVPSETFDTIDVVIGDSDLVQAMDLVIPLMDQNEKARVIIKSRFGYGDMGKGDEIPPNATLDVEVHLLTIHFPDEFELPIGDRIRIGGRKKDRGNFWYGRGDYSTAIQCYKSATTYLDAKEEELDEEGDVNDMRKHFDEFKLKQAAESGESGSAKVEVSDGSENQSQTLADKVQQLIELRFTAYNNLAAAQMKMHASEAALKSVDNALMLKPDNVKALFRKGKILASKGDLDEAIEVYRQALNGEPDNKAIQQELAKLINKRKAELVSEKAMYKRMLRLDNESEKKKGKLFGKKSWLKWGLIGGFTAMVSVLAIKFAQSY